MFFLSLTQGKEDYFWIHFKKKVMKAILTILLTIITATTFAQSNFHGKAIYMSKTTMDMSMFGKMSEQQKKQRMAYMPALKPNRCHTWRNHCLKHASRCLCVQSRVLHPARIPQRGLSQPCWHVLNYDV